MALTGLQIQKLLPKTNCKECGVNTCLAFAMKLAARKAEIGDCPYASEEAIQVLSEAYEPPVKGIQLGEDRDRRLGEETVLYRHEKTFVNQTLLAINVNDTDDPASVDATLQAVKDYTIERVGETRPGSGDPPRRIHQCFCRAGGEGVERGRQGAGAP
jgi:acetyl-CoA decarbonylase/synthase complex subunit gamma